MTYQVINPRPDWLADAETCVALDGQPVVVSLTASPLSNNAGMSFVAHARAVDAEGHTLMHADLPLATTASHVADHASLGQLGAQNIANAVVLAVLGEPQQVLTLHDHVLAAWSIRAMLAASDTGKKLSAQLILST